MLTIISAYSFYQRLWWTLPSCFLRRLHARTASSVARPSLHHFNDVLDVSLRLSSITHYSRRLIISRHPRTIRLLVACCLLRL